MSSSDRSSVYVLDGISHVQSFQIMMDPVLLEILPFDYFTREQVAQLCGVSYETVPSFGTKGRVSRFDGNKYYLSPRIKGRYTKTEVIKFYRKIYCRGALRLPQLIGV